MCLPKINSDEYPVSMTPYNSESKFLLLSELVTGEVVGKRKIYNLPSAFDTEASSFTNDDCDPVGLCYIWMFGVNDTIVYGRYIEDFADLIRDLNSYLEQKGTTLFIYVHFLKYDFSFIKKLLDWDDIFSRGMREPLYARYRHIEFRDSLILAGGKGLDFIGKKVLRKKILKATGDLDYDLVRHNTTPLTQAELHYCEMDVRVLCEYIREKIEDDGGINKIPYTNTGYVRRYVREKCFENRGKYMDLIDGLTMTPDCYLQCEKAFGGGAVGPNIKYVGEVVYDLDSYDIKSSYPYTIVARYFPMDHFTPVNQKYANENLNTLVTSMCCLFRLEIFNLQPKTDYCFPISESKCNEVIGARAASGRVITAAYVSINCTELDYQIYERFYDFTEAESIRVSRFRTAPRGYLPKPIIESVLKFFHDKTTLDGVVEKKQEYMLSKNMLNAVYGMMVEKPVRDEIIFGDDFSKIDKDYVSQVVKYNENRNRFLFYPWGVWVTAHARFRLYDAIYNIGDDWRYCDTDSVKFVGSHGDYFERVNNEAMESLVKLAERTGIPIDNIVPSAPNGEKKYLGVWEHEFKAKRFKTLGAKRYLVEYKTFGEYNDGELSLTVAGTNKKMTLDFMKKQALETSTDVFDLFKEDLIVPKEYAGRTISKFIDKPRCGYVTDYLGNELWYTTESGVYIEPASYSFSITEEMLEAIIYLTHDGYYTEGEI